MKLLDRYNRVTLLTTIIVMLITGIIYYQVISLILTRQIDKDLIVEENEIRNYVSLNHSLPHVFESNDQQITFAAAAPGSIERSFVNTLYRRHADFRRHRHHHHGEFESGRGLITSVSVGNAYYKVSIVESTVETEDLVKIIFAITIAVILLLLVILFLINRLVLSRLWGPFHRLLAELRSFSLADSREISRLKTGIDEFRELDQAIAAMSERAKADYKSLKAFTENAAHELLTPIAVINSKLDTLLQTDDLSQRQSKLLSDLYTAVSRLARLNQSLLLLMKIENRLVEGSQEINLRDNVGQLMAQFEELFQDKNLKVTTKLADKKLCSNSYLVDILLSNLIGNAVRHNHKDGMISVTLTAASLSIKNTGVTSALDQEQMFRRFHKSPASDGSGLGLTISKQICENLGFSLRYHFHQNRHVFTVNF